MALEVRDLRSHSSLNLLMTFPKYGQRKTIRRFGNGLQQSFWQGQPSSTCLNYTTTASEVKSTHGSKIINRSYTGGASGRKHIRLYQCGLRSPQGSVLGPSLFLYYINDKPVGLKSILRLFADDTISYKTVSNTPDAETLQADLDKLATWEQK